MGRINTFNKTKNSFTSHKRIRKEKTYGTILVNFLIQPFCEQNLLAIVLISKTLREILKKRLLFRKNKL